MQELQGPYPSPRMQPPHFTGKKTKGQKGEGPFSVTEL